MEPSEGNHLECWCGRQLATVWLLIEHRENDHGVPYVVTLRPARRAI